MSDFLKKFTSIFVVDEGEGSRKNTKPKTVQSPTIEELSSDSEPVESVVPNVDLTEDMTPKVSKRMTQLLLKAMENNNLKGFDYLEFKQALLSLQNMEMDEETRYKSVLTMSKAMGGTLEQVKQSAGHYLDVLKREYLVFQNTLKKRKATYIEQPLQKVEMLLKEKREKAEKIKKLQEEMTLIDQKVNALNAETQAQEKKIKKAKGDFEATYQHMQKVILLDLKKVDQYLGK